MNPDPEELLDELLDFENGVFPREVLTEIIERREEFAEPLLIALNDIREHPMDMTDDDTFFPIYVVYLLAQFREKRAWKPLLEILALPGEIPDQLFGDTITEDMGNILASLYDGDEQGLRDLIENPNVDEYVRAATGLDAYLTLMATGQISLASLKTYFGELLESKLERQPSFVWDCLATTCADLGFDNLLPSIEIAFSEGLCDPGFNGLEDIKKTLDSGGCDRWRSNAALIDDTISELSDWACFDSQPKSTKPTAPSSKNRLESLPSFRALQPVRVEPAAGRNEPCPCGSGKKYKKCCGDEATKAAALSAVREKINQSILHVRIDLMNAEFPIWREVLMSGHSTLADLHRVIQRSMPWENSHLHNFRHDTIDSRKANTADTHGLPAFEIQTQLAQFVDSSSSLVYTYDFGDDWEHLITITVWQGELKPAHLPICIAGENAAPPEDSGGVWGYANMLEIVADESHPDYEDMQEWLGEDFDPHHFCLEEINKQWS